MIKLISIILLCFVAVAIIVTVDSRSTRAQTEQLVELTVLQVQLEDISTEAEQLSALFRKIDGGQATTEQSIAVTNAAVDLALRERGLTTINGLRDYLLMLDSMYSTTLEEIRLMKVNPKIRQHQKPR